MIFNIDGIATVRKQHAKVTKFEKKLNMAKIVAAITKGVNSSKKPFRKHAAKSPHLAASDK